MDLSQGTLRQSRGDLQELGTSGGGGELMSKNYADGLCKKILGTEGRGRLLCSHWLMGPVHISYRRWMKESLWDAKLQKHLANRPPNGHFSCSESLACSSFGEREKGLEATSYWLISLMC